MIVSNYTHDIPGPCITSVLPDEVCPLDATSTTCEDFNATICLCEEGYTHRDRMCLGEQ